MNGKNEDVSLKSDHKSFEALQLFGGPIINTQRDIRPTHSNMISLKKITWEIPGWC